MKESTTKLEPSLGSASNTCAWRIPKATEPAPTTPKSSTVYPQRKVPALAPEPPVKIVPSPSDGKPKTFLERSAEFPDLKRTQKPKEDSKERDIESFSVVAEQINTMCTVVSNAKPSCIGGDFNFLEDDGWLDGDDIDYSQNLFQDNEHFLLPTSAPMATSIIPTAVCDFKAKTLLAERCHSSKKQDIWKRSEGIEGGAVTKTKIKILKRPEPEATKPKEHEIIVYTHFKDSHVKDSHFKDAHVKNTHVKDTKDTFAKDSHVKDNSEDIKPAKDIGESIIPGTASTSNTTAPAKITKKFNTASSSKAKPSDNNKESSDTIIPHFPQPQQQQERELQEREHPKEHQSSLTSDKATTKIKKFSTSLKLNETVSVPVPDPEIPKESVISTIPATTTTKIVYSSASKKLQKKEL